jgi:demethylmenaquinone methyltransferase/2-methoxy-6-polyprenyl-1,4-benzoquinol methylase
MLSFYLYTLYTMYTQVPYVDQKTQVCFQFQWFDGSFAPFMNNDRSLPGRIRTEIGDPARKRRYVRRLFGRIAHRYDVTNDVMSLGLHRAWKRRVLSIAGVKPGDRVLDLAAGTGDLALAASELAMAAGAAGAAESGSPAGPAGSDAAGSGVVVAGDLTLEMMRVGRERRGGRRIPWVGCDALLLPFRDGSFDCVVIGYGLRNFADLAESLVEIRCCLRPGGRLVALDFGKPRSNWLRRPYLKYLDVSSRTVGWLLHRDVEAYLYIPESLRRFPGQRGVTELMEQAGYVRCGWTDLLAGTMAINFGERPC